MTPTRIGEGKVRYSSVRASNSQYALLEQNDGFINLHKLDGELIKTLPRALRSDTQVVFSYADVNTVFYILENKIMSYDLSSDRHEIVKEFLEYVGFSANHAEGDLTPSGDLALAGIRSDGGLDVFKYSIPTGVKGKAYPQDESGFDGIKVVGGTTTLSGHLILSGDAGIEDLTISRKLTSVNGHACPCPKGLLWCSAADAKVNQNAACLIDLQNGDIRVLKSFSWAYAMHLSSGLDFAVVCVQDPMGSLPFQIWQVPFDGATPVMVHEWHSVYRGYDSAPKGSYSEGRVLFNVDDGKSISVWSLDMGLSVKFTPQPTSNRTRIDYSPYVGKSRFVLEPRADGSVDIFEEKL